MVRNVEIRRLDGMDYLCYGSRVGIGLDSMLEECSYGMSDDGKFGKVLIEGGMSCDWIGNMKLGVNEIVEDEGNCVYEIIVYDIVYGFVFI